MLKRHFFLTLLSAALLNASTAFAGAAAGSVAASATITSACTINASALTFPTLGGFETYSGGNSATTTLSVTCSNSTAYNIELNNGLYDTSYGPTKRVMQGSNASQTMYYALYQDAANSQIWGTTINTNTMGSTGTGAVQSFTVYGKVLSGYYYVPTTYSDTVTATVVY